MKLVTKDRLAIIRIEGMHSHQCEQAIQAALGRFEGVHEVETDFLSGQCSVLFDPTKAKIEDFTAAIEEAGYRPGDTSQGGSDAVESPAA
jgi:copper chaperone CopZ